MAEMATKKAKVVRKDGNPEKAFRSAAKIIERTYTAPFLAHNCMEPMNFFADVKSDSAQLSGPLQKAELTEQAIATRLGGIPESPLYANRFPAGAIDNYQAESWTIPTNITIGEKNDYDAERYAGVLKLVKEKSNWNNNNSNSKQGVAAYFCHNSYAAQVVDMTWENDQPKIQKVTCAIDCGIVINPDAANNLCEGGIVDGIGNALYGELTFKDGMPKKSNFDNYRMIRMHESPKEIEVYFVKNDVDPTGLGEPTFPPVFAAVANAMYAVTGKRFYNQPFVNEMKELI
ncbi:Isoquinoline 1-oxidoreductase subunit beta [Nymphon striatum]|nr:Isoquinoline 1-oxidoreductase subunit beta [Nymphon striatum]